MRHVVAIHVHPHLRPLLGGSPPGLESVHFSKAATVEKSIFRDPGSHAEIKGRGGESALGATRSGSTFPFYKRKGVLARLLMKGSANPKAQVSRCIYLLMKGSANPKAQVSMCTYLGMYRRMRMCAPANINVNVNDTGAHGPPRARSGDLSSCD